MDGNFICNIGNIRIKAFTGHGEVNMQTERLGDGYRVTLETPLKGMGRLVVTEKAEIPLERLELPADGMSTYGLIPGDRVEFYLP
jgi:hypothetical protein